jgi:SAM-dependent methyltransferase
MNDEEVNLHQIKDSGLDGYAINAQYYDLIFPETQRDIIQTALIALLPHARRIAEIGSGTGQFTEVLLKNLPPGGEIFAVEPAAVMRAALATRLTALGNPPVTILADDAMTTQVDGPLDAVVLLHVLTHFPPTERKALWAHWAPRLKPGGLVIVDIQAPQALLAVPPTVVPGRRLGRRYYDTISEATVDGDNLIWTMTYRIHENGRILFQESVSFPSYVASNEVLHTELHDAGYEPISPLPSGVLAWRHTG